MQIAAILFPFFFTGIFILVMFLISKRGWRDLASRFRYDDVFQGTRVGIASVGVNNMSYNNCFLLKYNEKGFHLKPLFIFRLFHPPVFIPWKEIRAVHSKKILFVKMNELVVGDPAIAFLQMKDATLNKMEYLKPGNWAA